jgi:hypothetical protein
MMIVPEAANMPPTPWQTEILAPGTCAGAMPRIWRTLSRKRTCRTCRNWLRHNPNPNRDERTVSVDGKSAP